MDYSTFQDSEHYDSSPSGAQLAARLTNEDDPTISTVGLLSLQINFNNELVPIREGGESFLREIAEGAGEVNGQISMVFTSRRSDIYMPSEETFLQRGAFTIEVYDGEPWVKTGGTVRFAITGAKFQNFSTSLATQGQVDINLSFMATRLYTGVLWAARSST